MAASVKCSVSSSEPLKSKPFIRFSSNKLKKMEAKKRKIKAYLNLALSDESFLSKKKRKSNDGSSTQVTATSVDDIDALRTQLRELRQKQQKDPVFYLTDVGVQAKVFGDEPAQTAIFLEDVQHLILLASLRIYSPVKPRWCRLLRANKVSHILVVSVEGLSSHDFLQYKTQLVHTCNTFSDILEIVPPSSFQTDISLFPATLNYNSFSKQSAPPSVISQPLKSLLPGTVEEKGIIKVAPQAKDVVSRTQLLLSAVQMIHEHYPLPVTYDGRDMTDYTWSLHKYEEVTDSSPIFAVDCEMCLSDQNMKELTRVSIINEKHEVCLDTLVKPKNRIIDYLTRYSGVTEEMLANVTTKLDDVKAEIQKILPPDAILCGQSLNFDLHALQIFHPYVIDTSVIFNLSGLRHRKSSLKHLSYVFLKETIQDSPEGHCSVEDSMATLKLVQMKLQRGLHFGDSILSDTETQKTESGFFSQSIFPMITSKQKDVCVIGNSESLATYSGELLPPDVRQFAKEKKRGIVKCTVEEAINHGLAFSHLVLPSEEDKLKNIKFVDESIASIYNACAENSLFVVIFTGSVKTKSNGLCMVRIKTPL